MRNSIIYEASMNEAIKKSSDGDKVILKAYDLMVRIFCNELWGLIDPPYLEGDMKNRNIYEMSMKNVVYKEPDDIKEILKTYDVTSRGFSIQLLRARYDKSTMKARTRNIRTRLALDDFRYWDTGREYRD